MPPTNRVYRVAVIPGDGIGKEAVPEGVRALEAVAKKFGFEVRQDWFDFASYDYYAKHGIMMPEDWKDKIGQHDAIFFGAVGWPAKMPDHISLWGSLILFRREFDQYVNLRPVRLMPGRSEEHTSELQSLRHLVCRLLLEKKNNIVRQY